MCSVANTIFVNSVLFTCKYISATVLLSDKVSSYKSIGISGQKNALHYLKHKLRFFLLKTSKKYVPLR
jgi:hypothetical protein